VWLVLKKDAKLEIITTSNVLTPIVCDHSSAEDRDVTSLALERSSTTGPSVITLPSPNVHSEK
jgi:superoxide dismutase